MILRALVLLAAIGVALIAPPSAASKMGASTAGTTVHVVKAGETLTSIAGRHAVSITALVGANRLTSAGVRLRIGQRLIVPAPTVARARRTPAAVVVKRPPTAPRTLVLAVPDFAELLPAFLWPVEGPVSSTFGRRRGGWHHGIDITAELGTPVAAAASGAVVTSTYESRYGRVIKIQHANGFLTIYAHNDENLVEVGERVSPGQFIASVGRTGRATTHHVHFEIRREGSAYNPLYMLPLPPRLTHVAETDDEEHDEGDD